MRENELFSIDSESFYLSMIIMNRKRKLKYFFKI